MTPERVLTIAILAFLALILLFVLLDIESVEEDPNKAMTQTINFKATATVQTDEGVFEAVISTMTPDREKDVVAPEAVATSLKKWNRPIPLAWQHARKTFEDPDDIIGHVEPMTARVVGDEVVIQGTVDLDHPKGKSAWRMFKNRSIGFSFGFLIPLGGTKARVGGGSVITAIDVYEITATPVPINNDTRVLATKGAVEDAVEEVVEDIDERWNRELAADIKALTERIDKLEQTAIEDAPGEDPVGGKPAAQDPLRVKTDEIKAALAADGVPSTTPEEPPPRPQPSMELDDMYRKTRELFLENLSGMEIEQ